MVVRPYRFGTGVLHASKSLLRSLEEQLFISPNAIMFTKSETRPGILPRLLSEILNTRVMVKNAMKDIPDSQKVLKVICLRTVAHRFGAGQTLKRMMDHRQYALKMIANVTYGYTSASFSGRMPCVDIAGTLIGVSPLAAEHFPDSIVQTARETLERAIRVIETEWKAEGTSGVLCSMRSVV